MISAFANSLKIPELRTRIFFTLLIIVVVRLGAMIPLPGVDTVALDQLVQKAQSQSGSGGAGTLISLMNVFSGGALQKSALFALGIMPYISASIMLQLLTAVVPQLGKLAREDGGRQKISLYTRYVAIALCIMQGWLLARSLVHPEYNIMLRGIVDDHGTRELVPDAGYGFYFRTVCIITAGTMLLMWLGDQITERGIGNGISIIITVNIIFALPGALVQVYKTYVVGAAGDPIRPLYLVALVFFLLLVIAAVIAITQAQRRVSVNYAKRMVGRKMVGGQTNYMPLKINYAGVMPIIFAQAILAFPGQIIGAFSKSNSGWGKVAAILNGQLHPWVFYTVSCLLIFFFSYFWVATMFQPAQIADDLKRNGGYIPGVRPGKPTAEFLDSTMSKLTFAGAIFLTFIYVLPAVLGRALGVPSIAAGLFGGTSLLIMVGVILDIMRQVETHLIQRHYDGFLRKGKIRGRYDNKPVGQLGAPQGSLLWLWILAAILVLVAVSFYIYSSTQVHQV